MRSEGRLKLGKVGGRDEVGGGLRRTAYGWFFVFLKVVVYEAEDE